MSSQKKNTWVNWVIALVCIWLCVQFVFPLLAQVAGAIGSFFQNILKLVGSVTDGVKKATAAVGNELGGDTTTPTNWSDMSDATNPWSPLYYQQSSIDASSLGGLDDTACADLVTTVQGCFPWYGGVTALLGGATGALDAAGNETSCIVALGDNISTQTELSVFCDYWNSHVGGSFYLWLRDNSPVAHISQATFITKVVPWVQSLPVQ